MLGGGFEEGGALQAFAWASDDDDAGEGGVLGELDGEFFEAFDWPALGGPSRGGGEDGVGLGVFDDDLRELFLSRVVGYIGLGDIGACCTGECEHAVDGVHRAGGVDALVVEEPAEFLGVFEAEALIGSGGAGEEPRAGEALAVEDHVVAVFAEFAEPVVEGGELELAALFAELGARKGDDFVEGGVVLDGLGEVVADHPVDLGIWVACFEGGEDRGGSADVSQGAWADDEDALWVLWIWHG